MERELAHVEKIIDIQPIPGADRVELATVLGWKVMVRKGQFKVGDLAVYIEIDSECPHEEPFTFLEKNHYKIKTQEYFKGTVLSQGLLMPLDEFNIPADSVREGDGLTEKLHIKYSTPEDNYRKRPSADKYKQMARRNPKLFKHRWAKWLMKRPWGKKVMFALFGRRQDKKRGWPEWVKRTDEIRIQQIPWILDKKGPWVTSEKLDGFSASYTLKRGRGLFGKDEFYVCSRNIVQEAPDQEKRHGTNAYWEIENRYNVRAVLSTLMDILDVDWITIQGEIYGHKIQKRDYGMKDIDFAAFNLITSENGRYGTEEMEEILRDRCGIPCVPIVDSNYMLPDTIDEILEYAGSESSQIDGGMREGVVFRSKDGSDSFKAVSNEYLLKYD